MGSVPLHSGNVRFSDVAVNTTNTDNTLSPALCPVAVSMASTAENRKMLAKLPGWLVSRWNRLVVAHKESHNEFPPFESFEAFIAREAKIACNPITSVQSVKEDVSHRDNEGFEKPKRLDNRSLAKGRSLFTRTNENKSFPNERP